jgi:hypothetical protein
MCPCQCKYSRRIQDMEDRNERFINDKVYREQILYNLTSKLRVNKTNLSSTKRRLKSMEDFRRSAMNLGYVGSAVIGLIIAIIVLSDLTNLVRHNYNRLRAFIRHARARPRAEDIEMTSVPAARDLEPEEGGEPEHDQRCDAPPGQEPMIVVDLDDDSDDQDD